MKVSPRDRAAFALAFGIAFGMSLPVWAQTVAAAGTVDLTPLYTNVMTAAVGILTVAAGILSKFAVSWLSSKTKLSDSQFEAGLSARLNDILLKAIDYAEARMKAMMADPGSQIHSVRFDSFFLSMAVQYAITSMPDIIKYFGLTPERIGEMIQARMNPYLEQPIVNSGVLQTAGAGTPGV